MRKLKITAGSVTIEAELLDTNTADAIYERAPFESRAMIWGDEVYFSTPVRVEREPDARDVIEPGSSHSGSKVTPSPSGLAERLSRPATRFAWPRPRTSGPGRGMR